MASLWANIQARRSKMGGAPSTQPQSLLAATKALAEVPSVTQPAARAAAAPANASLRQTNVPAVVERVLAAETVEQVLAAAKAARFEAPRMAVPAQEARVKAPIKVSIPKPRRSNSGSPPSAFSQHDSSTSSSRSSSLIGNDPARNDLSKMYSNMAAPGDSGAAKKPAAAFASSGSGSRLEVSKAQQAVTRSKPPVPFEHGKSSAPLVRSASSGSDLLNMYEKIMPVVPRQPPLPITEVSAPVPFRQSEKSAAGARESASTHEPLKRKLEVPGPLVSPDTLAQSLGIIKAVIHEEAFAVPGGREHRKMLIEQAPLVLRLARDLRDAQQTKVVNQLDDAFEAIGKNLRANQNGPANMAELEYWFKEGVKAFAMLRDQDSTAILARIPRPGGRPSSTGSGYAKKQRC